MRKMIILLIGIIFIFSLFISCGLDTEPTLTLVYDGYTNTTILAEYKNNGTEKNYQGEFGTNYLKIKPGSKLQYKSSSNENKCTLLIQRSDTMENVKETVLYDNNVDTSLPQGKYIYTFSTEWEDGSAKFIKLIEIENDAVKTEPGGNEEISQPTAELAGITLEDKLQDYEKTINSLQEENKRYKDFVNSLVNNMDESDLLTLAKSLWKYVVNVDDKPVPPDGNVQVAKGDLNVTISEIPDIFSILPPDVLNKGKISGNYYEHIKFLNCKPNSADPSSGMLDSMRYTFNSISDDSVLKFEVSKELQERTGLKTNIISVRIK